MTQAEQDHWFFREIQPHENQLRSYLKDRFPALNEVDDLIQEAYARLLKARKKGIIKEPKALLFTIARNLVYDGFRRKKVVQFESLTHFPDSFVLEDEKSVNDSIALRDEISLLVRSVESLPARCRQVMTLRMVYGYRTKEIAKQLNLSPNTVKAQLAKGMRRSAEFLARHGVGE